MVKTDTKEFVACRNAIAKHKENIRKWERMISEAGKAKRYLGRYSTPEEAYESWLSTKRSIVADVILRLGDTRIIQALKERYGL